MNTPHDTYYSTFVTHKGRRIKTQFVKTTAGAHKRVDIERDRVGKMRERERDRDRERGGMGEWDRRRE